MKVGIAIDEWKLPIFTACLTEAGYTFEQNKGLSPNTLLLTIIADDFPALEQVIYAANEKARKSKMQ